MRMISFMLCNVSGTASIPFVSANKESKCIMFKKLNPTVYHHLQIWGYFLIPGAISGEF